MSNFKPFWAKHAMLRRLVVLFFFLVSPILFPILFWEERRQVKDGYRELWSALK